MKKSTLSSDEDDDLIGGISIEEAKKRMQQEDQVDRQIYRERIKEKHKVTLHISYRQRMRGKQ